MNHETANELLLYCLKGEPDESKVARLEQLSNSDWNAVIQQAGRHGVESLLYQRLKTRHLKVIVPTNIIQTLRAVYLNVAWNNTSLYDELAKVLKVLQNENIPVILLKGAHLAEVVYGNKALRSMSDIDIMLKEEDLHKSVNLLFQSGFSVTDEKQAKYIVKNITGHYHILPHLKHFPDLKNGTIKLDVHCSIADEASSFNIDIDGLWKRARPTTIAGIEVLVLSPEDLLLHSCLHSVYSHFFEYGLRPLCDILETTRYYRDRIDWTKLEHCAVQWNTKNFVYLTLRLARELLAAEVPEELLNALKPKKFDEHLILGATEQVFANGDGTTNTLHHNSLKILSPEPGKTFLGQLMSGLLSPKTIAERYNLPQNSWKIYLYYPVRLKDLFLKYGYKLPHLLYQRKEREKLDRKYELVKWLELK